MNNILKMPTAPTTREDIDAELHKAMLLSGAIIPTTPEEVAFVEAYGDMENDPFPEKFRSPLEALEYGRMRRKQGIPTTFIVSSQDECREELARAAREGHEITSEVEKKMAEARRRAEGKKSED
jgi:hypothetical protein